MEDDLELIRPMSEEDIHTAIFLMDQFMSLGLELASISNTGPFSRNGSVLRLKTSLVQENFSKNSTTLL